MTLFCSGVDKEASYGFSANIQIHLFKVKNRDSRITCEIISNLLTKTREQNVNDVVLLSLLLALSMYVFAEFDLFTFQSFLN